MLVPDTVIGMGQLFQAGQSEDVTMIYHNAETGVTRKAIVEFCDDCVGGVVDGDFNDDGLHDCGDIDALVAAVVGGTNDAQFDLNGDGQVSLEDVNAWLVEAGGATPGTPSGNPYLPGDANLDGVVDVSDFNVWNQNKFNAVAAWCSGDFNVDGSVDVSDFNIWNGNKFRSSDAAAVPEPCYGILLFVLAAGAARQRVFPQVRR